MWLRQTAFLCTRSRLHWLKRKKTATVDIMENLKKVKRIFKSPALSAIVKWSKPVRGAVLLISCIGVVNSLLSLGVTLVTKALIDGATSGSSSALWIYGASLVALIVTERVLNIWSSAVNLKASSGLQKHMQGMVTEAILGKQYASLKGFHSGELVNRIFSDGSIMNSCPIPRACESGGFLFQKSISLFQISNSF